MPFDVKIKAVTLTQLCKSRLRVRRWREQVKRGGSDRVKYMIITLIGSRKQEQTSSTLPLGNFNCGWLQHLFNLQ